ncbi:MAG: hypothetical protein R6U22_02560 [Desulfohalobiaceae bacterium]
MPRMLEVLIQAENCRGCRRCEVACATMDRPPFNPRRAGIRVLKDEAEGSEYPVLNMECLERFCGKQIPGAQGALEPACVTACLFQALQMPKEDGDEQ